MRFRRAFLVLALLAAATILAATIPWARAETAAQGRAQVIVVDGKGDRHEKVWEFGGDHGWLGVSLSRDEEARGARVDHVSDDSPADRAGIQEADLIVAIDGDEVQGPADVSRRIRSLKAGDAVDLEIVRGGNRQTLRAELGEMPNAFAFFSGDDDAPFEHHFDAGELQEHMQELHERLADMDFNIQIPEIDLDLPGFAFEFGGFHRPLLGVQPIETTPELREHLGGPRDAGVLVGKVLEGMPAEAAGVRVGDLIVSVDGKAIDGPGDLVRALRQRDGETVSLEVVRDSRTLTIQVALPEPDEEDDHGLEGPAPVRRPTPPVAPTQKA